MTRRSRHRLLRLAIAAPLVLAAPGAEAAPVLSGEERAPQPIASHVNVCSHLDQYPGYSSIWGYTAPDGREYALLGTTDGVSVVNVTNHAHPYETGFINGAHSQWREIKVYLDYMYVVNENGGGLQIVSLADPENPRALFAYQIFDTAHDLTVEFENHMLYVTGTNLGRGGVMMLRLNHPEAPELYRTWDTQYAHDVHVRGDWMYVSAIRVAACYIVDISERRPMSNKGIIKSYPFAFTHNAWLNHAGTHLLTTDEVAGASTRVWDITDPALPFMTGAFQPPDALGAIPHNVFVDDGDLAYISYYTGGVRVVDVDDPYDPVEVAYYDTYPANNAAVFAGCWGVFPFYRNSPELFVASDMQTGLYVLEVESDLIDSASRAVRTTSAAPAASIPVAAGAPLRVSQPAPNPLAPGATTQLELAVDDAAALRVDVVDAAGRLVRKLANGSRSPGSTSISWDGRDEQGGGAAAGVYFLRVSDGHRIESRRVVVTR